MSRLVLGLVIAWSFFCLHAETMMSEAVCLELRKNVLVQASRKDVVSSKKLMKLMIEVYHSKTYEGLKSTTHKLKHALDNRGIQTVDDVEFVTFLDMKQIQSPRRRHTV